MVDDGRRARRRRGPADQPRLPARPVVVVREPRLELCHPDDFHALRDVDVRAAGDLDGAALPLVYPQRCSNHQQTLPPSTSPAFVPFSCTCAVSCCNGLYDVRLVPDDVAIPLPVHYVAAQDDDDGGGGGGGDDNVDEDSVCSDTNRHLTCCKFSQLLSVILRY